MNSVFTSGHLTADPVVKVIEVSGKQTTVVRFNVATNRFFRRADGSQGKDTTFVPCEAWDSGADFLAKYAHKGSFISLKGSLKNNTWEKDGQKMSQLRIRVEEFDLPNRNGASEGQDNVKDTQENDFQDVTVDDEESVPI